ncbi:uncharacterized protein LOC135129687 [Zophobas morio]|uniref:uncharacterized protein LOC135129687 n=1 Tax=Zophobas morio TaxID=2755281 RepID=UPI003082AF5D
MSLPSITNLTLMQSFFGFFLKTEVTFIPGLLDKYIGNYYNNTLCNGATWMFLGWFLLHAIFDSVLNGLLRKMKCQKYVRTRLQKSLWYLGFYVTACIYCLATLFRNQLQIIKMKEPFDSTNLPSGHLILGFIMMLTFYLHSAFWEGVKYEDATLFLSYLSLFLFLCFSYFFRFVEGSFRLNIVICVTHIMLELTRCTALLERSKSRDRVIGGNFALSILVFVVNYAIVIPVLFGYPLIKGNSTSVAILLSVLLVWLLFETYSSVCFKALCHWMNHTASEQCGKDIFECSLFPPRSDATYTFLRLQKEMKERQEKGMAAKRPKNRNMVFQTLKCMVAMKRKIKERRKSIDETKQSLNDENREKDENGIMFETYDDVDSQIVDGKIAFNINGKSKQE